MSNAVGKFTLGAQKGKTFNRKNFYVEEGSNVFRVLPPFGSLSDKGRISQFWEVFWIEGTGGRKKPVPSIFNKAKDGTVLQQDPLKDRVLALDATVKKMRAEGAPEAQTKALADKVFRMGPDKSYYLNVLTPNNEIGVLKIKYTSWQAFLERLDELSKEGVDPINVGPENGIFFDFKRKKDDKGKVVYTVDVATRTSKDPNSGKTIKEYMSAPIDENILKRMETEAQDLTKLFTQLTPDQQALVATLDPQTIDRVFQKGQAVDVPAEEQGEGGDVDVMERMAAVRKATSSATSLKVDTLPEDSLTQKTVTKPSSVVENSTPVQGLNAADQAMVEKLLFGNK